MNDQNNFSWTYLQETALMANTINTDSCEKCVKLLAHVRKKRGRLFILGVGGSAGNAGHAVNDFRKIAGFEAYAPTDNISEITARTNDEGWNTIFIEWLKGSRLNREDCLLVLSVGGGSLEKNVSACLVSAVCYAKEVCATVIGITGPDGGITAQLANECVQIPNGYRERMTPHSEEFQAVIWHLFVTHPLLKINQTKWESVIKYE